MFEMAFGKGSGRAGRRSIQQRAGLAAATELLHARVLLAAVMDDDAGLMLSAVSALPRTEGFLQQPGGFLTGPSQDDPITIARNVLVQRAADLGVTVADVSSLRVTSTTSGSGLTNVYFRQQFRGIDLDGTTANVSVAADGRVLSIGNRLVPDVAGRVSSVQSLTAGEAVASAAAFVGVASPQPGAVRQSLGGAGQGQVFSGGNVSRGDVPTQLVYQLGDDGRLRLAWNLSLQVPGSADWFDMNVDAATGRVLSQSNWTHYAAASNTGSATASPTTVSGAAAGATTNGVPNTGRYNVYALPAESPNDQPRGLVVDPADPTASPFGWHDVDGVAGPESTLTRGNNVSAQEDRNADNTGGFQPDGGPTLDFNFPLDELADPVSYESAAVTQLFFTNNILHDIHYQYGFDEESGNFQVNNYGRGGLGGDAVQADAQDGTGFNNANFATPPDGQAPRMQQYIFTTTTPRRDSSLDNGIIIHEYGHGVSTRLTGGPADSNSLNARQSAGMGEGWSDFWTLMFTQQAGDSANQPFPLGTYVLGQSVFDRGIRRVPYSFDTSINPLSYGDFNISFEAHDAGEIWASALWDLNWLLIDKHGYDSDLYAGDGGNNLLLQLVMDGLKIQPANPSFLDGRDAILAADQNLTGGENAYEIWTAFARRGMGLSAFDGGSGSARTVTEAFDRPAMSHGTVELDREDYALGAHVVVTVQDSDLSGQASLPITVTSSGGDSEVLTLTETSPGTFRAALPTAAGVPATNNGVLQLAGGQTLSVTYQDLDDGDGPGVETDSAGVFLQDTLYYADFSDAAGGPSLDGFTIDNAAGTGGAATGQWHLSQGRGADPGHSGDDSVYYGANEGPNGGGLYGNDTTGFLTSPVVNIVAGPLVDEVRLRFNYFLAVEAEFDFARFQMSVDGGPFNRLAASEVEFPATTGRWVPYQVDLTNYIGHSVQFRFILTADSVIPREGWYVDDFEIAAVTTRFGRIAGTVYQDADGDAVRDPGEPGLAGRTVYFDSNDNGVFDQNLQETEIPSPNVPEAIGDLFTSVSSLIVSGAATLSDLDVTLDITHSYAGDLYVVLVSPLGTQVELTRGVGGLNGGFRDTTFDDEALRPITAGSATFTGRFRPLTHLSAFDGEDPNGLWLLQITDEAPADTGLLNSWSLHLKNGANETFRVTDAQGAYAFDNLTAGGYHVRQAAAPGDFPTQPQSGAYDVALTQNQIRAGLNFGTRNTNAAPVLGAIPAVQTYLENSAPRLLAPAGTVIDVDTPFLAGGQFTVRYTAGGRSTDRLTIRHVGSGVGQIGVNATTIRFGGTPIGTFTGGLGTTPLVVTFNASATPEAARALLRSIEYQTFSDDPTVNGAAPSRTLRYLLTDGEGATSAAVTQTLNITALNDRPIVNVPSTTAWTENTAPRPIGVGAVVFDPDSRNFDGGQLKLSLAGGALATDRLTIRNLGTGAGQVGVSGSDVTFGGAVIASFTGGSGATPLVVTFNALATPTAVQAVLRNTLYQNLADNPTAFGTRPTRTVRFFLSDGDGGNSVPADQTLTITALKDAPVIGGFDGGVTYRENGVGVLIDANATITDVDTASFNGGRLNVALTTAAVPGDRLTIRNQGTAAGQVGVEGMNLTYGGAFVGTFSGGVGPAALVVNFSSNATPAAAQAILRNVLFSHTSDSTAPARTVRAVLLGIDGQVSNSPEKSIEIVAVNDAPVVNGFSDPSVYTAGAGPTVLDGNVTVSDPDSDFVGGSITLAVVSGAAGANRLGVRNVGTGANQIGVSGNAVTFAGTTIGTLNASGGIGGTPLTVTFNAAATRAAVQALLRNLTFHSTAAQPGSSLTLRLTVRDGDGAAAVVGKNLTIASNFAAFTAYADWSGAF